MLNFDVELRCRKYDQSFKILFIMFQNTFIIIMPSNSQLLIKKAIKYSNEIDLPQCYGNK